MSRSIRRGAPPAVRGRVATALGPLVLVATGLLVPRASEAQEGCIFGEQGRNDVNTDVLPGIGRVTYVGGPHFVCDGGVQIFADSAVAYGDRGMSDFIGSVRYVEERRELLADEARYFTDEGRIQAQGNVRLVDEEQGSSIENGDLVYLLQTEFRDTSEMTVTVGADGIRPRAVLTPPPDTARADSVTVADTAALEAPPRDTVDALGPSDSAGAASRRPYNVVADRQFIRGTGYFAASGDVVIDRDSLFAYADSAEYDPAGEGLALVGNARVDGESYDLTGRTIIMTDPGGDASEIRALREAHLTGEDLLLTAARIVVGLQDGGLQRLVATPIAAPGTPEVDSVDLERPEADVEEFVLTADSLDVFAPGERLQRVFASGRARSVSTARDSLNAEVLPEIARHDWLEGDTVIIRFVGSAPVPPIESASPADSATIDEVLQDMDSVAVADTMGIDSLAAGDSAVAATGLVAIQKPSEEAEVEEIVARIDARSLYRLPPNDSTFRAGADAPAVHYVVGREIRIRLESGEVQGMSVTGQTRGVHLEPLQRPAPDSAAAADTAAVPDSGLVVDSAAVPDTGAIVDSAAVPDTGAVAWDDVPWVWSRASRDTDGGAEIRSASRLPTEGPGTKIAGSVAREPNPPNPHDGPSGPPEEHPWIRR